MNWEIDVQQIKAKLELDFKPGTNDDALRSMKSQLDQHSQSIKAIITDVYKLRDKIDANYQLWMKQNEWTNLDIENSNSFMTNRLSLFEHENKAMNRELERYHSLYREMSKSFIPNLEFKSQLSTNLTSIHHKRTSINMLSTSPISSKGILPESLGQSRNQAMISKGQTYTRRRKKLSTSITSLEGGKFILQTCALHYVSI